MNGWYLGFGIALVLFAAWFAQVEVTSDQYAAASIQWCEQHDFGATGQCASAYPTGTVNLISDTVIIILLAGAFTFLFGFFVSSRRDFGWRGGALLGSTCAAVLLVLVLANSWPSPYGGSTPIGTELAVKFAGVSCPSNNGSPPCEYTFGVENAAGNLTANDLWIVLADSNGSVVSLASQAFLYSTSAGCVVAEWSFASHAWSATSSDGCLGRDSSSPIERGDTIAVSPSLPGRVLSGKGYELVIVGNSKGVDGWMSVNIP